LLLETRKEATVVPASVVQRGPDGTFAFVISNDVAVVRPVQVALTEGDQALIDGGLAPGERVVIDGQYKLQPGSKVKPTEAGASGRSLGSKPGQRPRTNDIANPTQLQGSSGQ
jgi:multidrug efflux system membrane fusion protein